MNAFRSSRADFGLAAALVALLWAAAMPSIAASSATSSASDSVSTSSGSVSGSFEKSSNSSSRHTDVADGDYRVIEVAAIADRPGMVRIKLHAVADAPADTGSEFSLVLRREALDGGGVGAGHVVTARQRPYGIEFASDTTRQAFFLLLADDWYRELQTHAVAL